MRVQAGLEPEDWRHWGEWSTFKENAAELLSKALRPQQVIYCSPLTDPYQPVEEQARLMPGILEAVDRGADLPLRSGLEAEAEIFGSLCGTADKHEGLRAFLEKRPPVWQRK